MLLGRAELHVQPEQHVVDRRALHRTDGRAGPKRRDALERRIAPGDIAGGVARDRLHVVRAHPQNALGRFERRLRKQLQRIHRPIRMIMGQRQLGQADALRALPLIALCDKLDDLAVFLGVAIGAQDVEQAAKPAAHARLECPRRYHRRDQARDEAEHFARQDEHDRRQAARHRRRDCHDPRLEQPREVVGGNLLRRMPEVTRARVHEASCGDGAAMRRVRIVSDMIPQPLGGGKRRMRREWTWQSGNCLSGHYRILTAASATSSISSCLLWIPSVAYIFFACVRTVFSDR